MPPTSADLRAALPTPAALEALFQADERAFRAAFAELDRATPDSDTPASATPERTTLRVWRARLDYRAPARAWTGRPFWTALAIALGVALAVRLPGLWLDREFYYGHFAPSLVIFSVATYFWARHRDRHTLAIGAALALIIATYAAFLPAGEAPSVVMALIHLPILAWAFLGVAFAGPDWRGAESRLRFVRYNGDLLILVVLVGLSGVVFSGLTVALFSLINKDADKLYFDNVGLMGAVAVPVAATFLYDVVFNGRTGIAPVLARAFTPLFLVMTATYLVVALVGGKNPFVDRQFLITVNGLLLIVLGMTVFSIAERDERGDAGWTDYVHFALLGVTLLIDAIALSAIVFRLSEYGFTPNRVVVLGANVVILAHLAWMWRASLGFIRGNGDTSGVRCAVTAYLPVYVVWAALVAFGLPLAFGFR